MKKVLIANRGEIALRINRACHELGLSTVAVYSTADADALHVKFADESVCIGPPQASESYLHMPALLSAAEITGADAVHPGYGFLAENATFARACEEMGLTFIGPSPDVIDQMGHKIRAKEIAQKAGVPTLPSLKVNAQMSEKEILSGLEKIGYPVLIKAAMGGGGRGMKLVHSPQEWSSLYQIAKSESLKAFGSDEVYVEKFCVSPRHVEIQILGDQFGKVLHFGERDCSIQRRHQKLVEEALCPVLDPKTRDAMGKVAIQLANQVGYFSAGTVEFVVDKDLNFFFLEMNTRIQVEHPVTEMVTGRDLLKLQIEVAQKKALSFEQKDIQFRGHAIECRILAEDPKTFQPCPGMITLFHPPMGFGVRLESTACSDYFVPPYYDSMIAKLIVHAEDRPAAIEKTTQALREFVIHGIKTTIPLHLDIMSHPQFREGNYDTKFLENRA
jgi:acetyl-CoA carboxylase biotin carboxylase subunit